MKNNNLTLAVLSVFSILVAANSLHLVYAQENMTDVEEPKFFAIQHAYSGSISEINETAYTLELNDVSDKTILFSDRPDRIVTSVSTADFIGNWNLEDSFTIDPPNAVLIFDDKIGEQDIVIVELFNPIYDSNSQVLKYNIILDNITTIELQKEFGQTTITIDAIGPGGVPPLDGCC